MTERPHGPSGPDAAALGREETRREIERVARDSYGRLIAYLSAAWRDLSAAEDALSEAFVAALEAWPRTGLPERPEAWLLTAARRRLIDAGRRGRVRREAAPSLIAAADEALRLTESAADIPDERLRLLFLCAHPSLDPAVRAPLMMQTVLGMDAARIASAFLVKPATMGQRLVRAKAKIRSERIVFELPDPSERPERLTAVLDAIYAAFGSGWESAFGADGERGGLADEAVYLGRLLARLMPDEPEALGLLSLMLHCEARRRTRRDADGTYVPLSEQRAEDWDRSLIAEAERRLASAARLGSIGRFQLEAAIQSVHALRARTGRIEREELALLYEGLHRLAPTASSAVGRAASAAEARGPELGLALLAEFDASSLRRYQPYWALRAHLLGRLHRVEEALEAYRMAIGLSADPAVRDYLGRQASRLKEALTPSGADPL